MFLPEYIYWILLGLFLVAIPLTHSKTLLYRWRRRTWWETHVRIFVHHLNHTTSSAWIPVDAQDNNSKIVTYEKKTYMYLPERVYRLPPSFGLYAREPTMFCIENNPMPLDMVQIMKERHASKTPDEVYAAINSKVFIEMMAGVNNEKAIKWLLIALGAAAVIFFIVQYMNKTGAT